MDGRIDEWEDGWMKKWIDKKIDGRLVLNRHVTWQSVNMCSLH